MMQPFHAGIADVHGGSLSDGNQSFQDPNVSGIITIFLEGISCFSHIFLLKVNFTEREKGGRYRLEEET
jgi:hypothetical protein